jgi:hypothetical protein
MPLYSQILSDLRLHPVSPIDEHTDPYKAQLANRLTPPKLGLKPALRCCESIRLTRFIIRPR